jgi:hypothetical protein
MDEKNGTNDERRTGRRNCSTQSPPQSSYSSKHVTTSSHHDILQITALSVLGDTEYEMQHGM